MPLPLLAAIPAIASAAGSIWSGVSGAKKDKEARKQSAKAQGLAVEADREAKRLSGERYRALDPFRNAAFAELGRANATKPATYAAIRAGRYQGEQDAALKSALSGPDRTALTRTAMADYDAANARGLQDRFRSVGSNAAKFGRLGMQVNEQAVRDVEREYEGDRQRNANELIRQATEATVGDRYRALGATSDLNRDDVGLQERNRSFDYGTKRDAEGDRGNAIARAQGLAGTGFDNGQVLDASQNGATRGALGDAAAINRASADSYGRSAVDAAAAAGRFLALPKTNAAPTAQPALDPALLAALSTRGMS